MNQDSGYFANLCISEDDTPYIEAKIPVSNEYVKEVLEKGRLINVGVMKTCCRYNETLHSYICEECNATVTTDQTFCEDCGATLLF